jgi:hypothetical protein
MVVEHQNDHCLTNADYFLHVGADLCYDPLLQNYIQQVAALQRRSPAPTKVPIAPEHQPYFCGPCVNVPRKPVPPLPATQPSPNRGSVAVTCGLQHLLTWPVSFGQVSPGDCCDLGSSQCLYNSKLTRTANMLAHFNWPIYGFNSRHFVSAISKHSMPFCVVLAYNLYSNGRDLFQSMTLCKHVLDGASLLLDHIWRSGITSKLTGYIIHLQQQSSTEPTKQFWDIQSQIITQLRITRALSLVVTFVRPDHDN